MTPPQTPVPGFTFDAATVDDLDAVLPVVAEFYGHFGFPWEAARKRRLLAGLLADPDAGRLWVARQGGRVVGYALVAFYFSLEFDGRTALLDEFYLDATTRGHGVGGCFLEAVIAALCRSDVRVLRLEVEGRHPDAARLYARHGFQRDGREAWSRRLP